MSDAVLIVDDDKAVRSLAGRILRREGFSVLEAADADEARRLAGSSEHRVRLLLTDVVLPDTDGARLARELRQDAPSLTVIFMSGYQEAELEERGIREVGAAYITKPFSADVLTLMVRGALGE